MNHINRYTIILFLSLLFLASCEQESISTTVSQTAVLTGYLHAGQSCDSIHIIQSISYGDEDSIVSLDNLYVTINDDSNTFELTAEGDGYYQNTNLLIQSGESYTIQFEHNDEMVSATTFIPWKKDATISDTIIKMEKIEAGTFPPIGENVAEAIEISWDNSEGDYYYVVVHNIENDPEYINDFFANQDGFFRNFRFTSEPQISDYYNIDPNREIRQFGTHRVIIFRVNPEYAALYNVSEASSLSITEPPSNVINGLGILTGIASDTLYFEVQKE